MMRHKINKMRMMKSMDLSFYKTLNYKTQVFNSQQNRFKILILNSEKLSTVNSKMIQNFTFKNTEEQSHYKLKKPFSNSDKKTSKDSMYLDGKKKNNS